MNLKDRLVGSYVRIAASLEGSGAMALWALLSLLLLVVIVAWLNPAKAGSYLWIVSKLSLAAVLGYGFDRATGAPPESSMASSAQWPRRAARP